MQRPQERKTKRTSPVWKYFVKNPKTNMVQCLICKRRYTYGSTCSTTNLLKHLKNMHHTHYLARHSQEPITTSVLEASANALPEVIKFNFENLPSTSNALKEEFVSPAKLNRDIEKVDTCVSNFSPNEHTDQNYSIKVITEQNCSTSEVPEQNYIINETSDQSAIDKSLVDMLCTDLQPLHYIENVGFRNLIFSLKPNYIIPTEKTLTEQLLPERYQSVKAATIDMLNKTKYISMAIEVWPKNLKTFLTLTIHLVNDSILTSLALESKELDSNSSENISQEVFQILENWQINQKVFILVLPNKQNEEYCNWTIMPDISKTVCVAHEMDIIVGNVIHRTCDKLMQLVQKCRQIIDFISQNDKQVKKLEDIQKGLILEECKLKKDIPTRWNTVLCMMKQIVKLKVVLNEAVPGGFTIEDWKALDDCVAILNLIDQFIEIISSELYPFLSCIIPLIRGLTNSLNTKFESDVGSQLSSQLYAIITKQLHLETNKVTALATFLDPRFKRAAFSSELYAEQAQKWAIKELTQKFNEEQPQKSLANKYEHSLMKGGEENGDSNGCGLWDFFDKKVQVGNYYDDSDLSAVASVNQYVELAYLDRKLNPLEFWESKKHVYPGLYDMATKYLCIPATAVPAERIFSKQGIKWKTRRNLLESRLISEMLFMNSFLKCYDF